MASRKAKDGPVPLEHAKDEVSEFGARLQPTVGSKRVLDWQPLHLLQHSPPQFHDNKPLYDISDDGLVLAPGGAPTYPC
jgi:hypothetical protein